MPIDEEKVNEAQAPEPEEDYGFLDDDPGYEFSEDRAYVDYCDSEDDLVDYD